MTCRGARTRDPWAVLVSEVMLQQTQAPRVAERYGPFLEQFPTPAACAERRRRCRGGGVVGARLQPPRREPAPVRDGRPSTGTAAGCRTISTSLLALPGIGPYTARAVLVFAFEHDIGLVDTNAGRFVARALAGRAITAARGAGDGRRRRATGPRLGLGPDGVRPGRDACARRRSRRAAGARSRDRARGGGPAAPNPTPFTGRPASARRSRPSPDPSGRAGGACWPR